MLAMTAIARNVQEAALETAAFEVRLELLLDIRPQGRIVGREVHVQRWIVFLDGLIKAGTLPTVADVWLRAETPELASLPAGNGNTIASLRCCHAGRIPS